MKKVVILIVFIVVIIVVFVIDTISDAGAFKTIKPHFSGSCTRIAGVVGAEDITIHPRTSIAYISVHDRRAEIQGKDGMAGIYSYDLNKKNPKPLELTSNMLEDFQPHGISLFVGDKGEDVLFVVNHSSGKQQIEVFNLKNGKLSHRETIEDTMLRSPNDIVAVGYNSFYFTNDHKYGKGLMNVVEDYLPLGLSSIVYYNGRDFKEVFTGVNYAIIPFRTITMLRTSRILTKSLTTNLTRAVFRSMRTFRIA